MKGNNSSAVFSSIASTSTLHLNVSDGILPVPCRSSSAQTYTDLS